MVLRLRTFQQSLTPCDLVDKHQRFIGARCLRLQAGDFSENLVRVFGIDRFTSYMMLTGMDSAMHL